jgi:hypothetical protein
MSAVSAAGALALLVLLGAMEGLEDRLQAPAGGRANPVAALVERIGALTTIEIARTGSIHEVLVVPAFAFDTEPIAVLRAVLRSPAFQRSLIGFGGYSARCAGQETRHEPDVQRAEWQRMCQVTFIINDHRSALAYQSTRRTDALTARSRWRRT